MFLTFTHWTQLEAALASPNCPPSASPRSPGPTRRRGSGRPPAPRTPAAPPAALAPSRPPPLKGRVARWWTLPELQREGETRRLTLRRAGSLPLVQNQLLLHVPAQVVLLHPAQVESVADELGHGRAAGDLLVLTEHTHTRSVRSLFLAVWFSGDTNSPHDPLGCCCDRQAEVFSPPHLQRCFIFNHHLNDSVRRDILTLLILYMFQIRERQDELRGKMKEIVERPTNGNEIAKYNRFKKKKYTNTRWLTN